MDSEEKLEWWETFDGILEKFKEVVEENKNLKQELELLKKVSHEITPELIAEEIEKLKKPKRKSKKQKQ